MQNTHCQICARDIKARTGVIAHHGYQRPGNGYQTSSCLGARYRSYEESRDRIPQVIRIYKEYLENNKLRLKDMLANPPEELTVFARYSFDKDNTYKRPENFNVEETLNMGSWRYDQRYEAEFKSIVRQIKNNITGLTYELETLQKRYDEWPGAVK